MSTQNCRHCGQTHPVEAVFCPNTGRPIVIRQARWGWQMPLLVALIVVVGAGLLGMGIWSLSPALTGRRPSPTESPPVTRLVEATLVMPGTLAPAPTTTPMLAPTLTPTTPPSQPITGEPNLELYVQGMRREPLGGGLQRVAVILSAKNASSAWHLYWIESPFFSTKCVWGLGHELGDPISSKIGDPILHTEEGYEYTALKDRSMECGPRYTGSLFSPYNPGIPPGIVVTAIGDTFSRARPFGWMFFEIAEGVSPEWITVQYQSGEPYDVKTTTIDLGAPYDGPIPFDPAYSLRIYHPGESIAIGEAATVVVGRPLLDQGSLTIPLTVSSLNRGYPLKFRTIGGFFISMVNGAGILCCDTELSYGSNPPYSGDPVQIGPLQSWEVRQVLRDIPAGTYWLIGAIGLLEVSPAGTRTESTWVVEIDVSE